MSYNENVLLCNLVAVMNDFSKSSGDNLTPRNPGPTYSGIISLRPGARKLDELGFHLAREAHKHLSLQYASKGVTPLARGFINSFGKNNRSHALKRKWKKCMRIY